MGKKRRKTGMSKKILIGMGIFVVIIALLVGIYFIQVYKPAIQEKKQLIERFSEFESQYQEKKAQGYDVSATGAFARKAKRAFDSKDYKMANGFLNNAFEALEKAEKIPPLPETVKEEAKEKLSRVRIVSLYERVTDGALIGRSVEDVIRILNETKTDFIFRGFWRWRPCPESPETASDLIYPQDAEVEGYTYEQLREATSKIKREMPDVIFCGGVSAQRLNRIERNPLTGEIIEQEETWGMAFDPGKWGIDISKEEAQCKLTKSWYWISQEIECPEGYEPEKVPAYFPDITNENFQELLLSWAKKQIDCGADAIWIDMLFKQATIIERWTGNPYHPAVKESYEAASQIVDEIHRYGESKGKYIYVGTWLTVVDYPYSPPDIDFVTATPSSEEVVNKKLDTAEWTNMKAEVEANLGEIPTFAFIDFGNDGLPLAIFSQKLTKSEQREFLKTADEFFQKKGINFIYPLHGGFTGKSATILAFGNFRVYDILAPEFDAYDTIKELAQSKSKIGVE